jgi:hypothetical protein
MISRLTTSAALLFCLTSTAASPTHSVIEKDATVLGFKIHYLEAGNGSPVVLENLELRLRSAFTISKLLESGASGIGGMTEEEMRTIKAPTLIVWGKYDELVGPPERTGERLLRDISGSRLVVIDNAGHLPQLEQADDFNRVVTDFFEAGRHVLVNQVILRRNRRQPVSPPLSLAWLCP